MLLRQPTEHGLRQILRKPFKTEPKMLFQPTSSACTTTTMPSVIDSCQLAPCPPHLFYEVHKERESNADVPTCADGQKRGNRLTMPRGDKLSEEPMMWTEGEGKNEVAQGKGKEGEVGTERRHNVVRISCT